jgi:hypothetical protein
MQAGGSKRGATSRSSFGYTRAAGGTPGASVSGGTGEQRSVTVFGTPPRDGYEILDDGEPTPSSATKFGDYVGSVGAAMVSVSYVILLICLTVFWASPSLITLLVVHVLILGVAMMRACSRQNGDKDKSNDVKDTLASIVYGNEVYAQGGHHRIISADVWAFHLYEKFRFFNAVHILVLLFNLAVFCTDTYNSAPPITLRLNTPSSVDHRKWGEGGFGLLGDNYIPRTMPLAQKGYYYAEEYTGNFGLDTYQNCNETHPCTETPPATVGMPCGVNGWKCYAIGVRHFTEKNTRVNGKCSSNVYQPLPTPDYEVELQVGVSVPQVFNSNVQQNIVSACDTLEPIYVQHVTGAGNVISHYRPLLDLAVGHVGDKMLCPNEYGHHIGCIGGQRQTEADYRASIRAECTKAKETHYATIANHRDRAYEASYFRIPGAGSTVDMPSGGIRHTIIIVKDTSTPTAPMKPPMFRIRPRESRVSIPFSSAGRPVARVWLGSWGDATTSQVEGSKLDTAGDFTYFDQTYGFNAPNENLAKARIPDDYRRVNFPFLIRFYLPFFFLLLCIDWYAAVTTSESYAQASPLYQALMVRVPLMFVGVAVGALWYIITQLCIIGGLFSRMQLFLEKEETSRKMCTSFLTLIAVGFGIAHLILWDPVYHNRDSLLFRPYFDDEPHQVGAPAWGWSQNLLTPFAVCLVYFEAWFYTIIHGVFVLWEIGKWVVPCRT